MIKAMFVSLISVIASQVVVKPLKVFILAGQSNTEAAVWKRGASNVGYHYLGCAKTFALKGKAFAEANFKLLESQRH